MYCALVTCSGVRKENYFLCFFLHSFVRGQHVGLILMSKNKLARSLWRVVLQDLKSLNGDLNFRRISKFVSCLLLLMRNDIISDLVFFHYLPII